MRKIFLAGPLLAAVLTVSGPRASAQEQQKNPRFQVTSSDLAVTYTTETASVTPTGAGNFWLQGASLDGAITFYRNFGVASNLTGDYAPHIAAGVGLGKLSFMMGPRYTYTLRTNSKHETRVFGEALAGVVKGFGSVFPTATGVTYTADSFSWQTGGGVDVSISKHLAIRGEADYVRTYLPDNAGNVQGQLRLAFGVTYHVGKQ